MALFKIELKASLCGELPLLFFIVIQSYCGSYTFFDADSKPVKSTEGTGGGIGSARICT